MIETLLYVFGLYELYSKLTEEMHITLRQIPNGTLLYVFDSYERCSKLTEEMNIPWRPIPNEDRLRH